MPDPRQQPPCPNCSTAMITRKCKFICPSCGYFTDCGEGDVNLKTEDS